MNNFLSYCGLVDARISASEKDLPVKEEEPFQKVLAALRVIGHGLVLVFFHHKMHIKLFVRLITQTLFPSRIYILSNNNLGHMCLVQQFTGHSRSSTYPQVQFFIDDV